MYFLLINFHSCFSEIHHLFIFFEPFPPLDSWINLNFGLSLYHSFFFFSLLFMILFRLFKDPESERLTLTVFLFIWLSSGLLCHCLHVSLLHYFPSFPLIYLSMCVSQCCSVSAVCPLLQWFQRDYRITAALVEFSRCNFHSLINKMWSGSIYICTCTLFPM